jgi:hypothetical protein
MCPELGHRADRSRRAVQPLRSQRHRSSRGSPVFASERRLFWTRRPDLSRTRPPPPGRYGGDSRDSAIVSCVRAADPGSRADWIPIRWGRHGCGPELERRHHGDLQVESGVAHGAIPPLASADDKSSCLLFVHSETVSNLTES